MVPAVRDQSDLWLTVDDFFFYFASLRDQIDTTWHFHGPKWLFTLWFLLLFATFFRWWDCCFSPTRATSISFIFIGCHESWLYWWLYHVLVNMTIISWLLKLKCACVGNLFFLIKQNLVIAFEKSNCLSSLVWLLHTSIGNNALIHTTSF